jgi:hypothetical protein
MQLWRHIGRHRSVRMTIGVAGRQLEERLDATMPRTPELLIEPQRRV